MVKSKEETINIKPLKIGTLKVKVVGTSDLLCEPMDMAVLDRYDKKKSMQNYEKDTMSEEDKAKEKYYYTKDGKKGFPARAFYNAMIRASSYLFEKSDGGMRNIREGVTIQGDILPLKYKKESRVTHWGRTSGMSKAPRKIIRNAFSDWSVELTIQYNQSQLSAENIINVLNWAGFHVGVGGFRKENTGNYGAFTVKI
jgi:hypothetical protein